MHPTLRMVGCPLTFTFSFLLSRANMEIASLLSTAHSIQTFTVSFCILTSGAPVVSCDTDPSCSWRKSTLSHPLSSFQLQIGCQVGYCLFVIHKQQTQPGNLTLLPVLGMRALKGELHSVSITLRASPFFFYSGCFPLEVTHIFKNRFQFITSSFLPEVTGSLCSSENTSQAHPGYEPPPLTVLKSVPGRLVRRLLCFHELCVLLLSPWLSQGFQKKKRRGSPQWKHSAHAKTTCWGDRSGLFFDISWSDSQLLWGCQARTFPAWHLCCSSPRAV